MLPISFGYFKRINSRCFAGFFLAVPDEGEDVAEVVGEFEFLFAGAAFGGLRDRYTEACPALIFAREDHKLKSFIRILC